MGGDDQNIIERQLNPGESFSTGLNRSKLGRWMFMACPVGYVSSVLFHPANDKLIRASQYSCTKK